MAEVSYDFQPGIFLRVPATHFDHVMDKGKVNPDIAGKKSKLPINFEDGANFEDSKCADIAPDFLISKAFQLLIQPYVDTIVEKLLGQIHISL